MSHVNELFLKFPTITHTLNSQYFVTKIYNFNPENIQCKDTYLGCGAAVSLGRCQDSINGMDSVSLSFFVLIDLV